MTRSTIVRPYDPGLRSCLQLAGLFALLKLVLHVAINLWQAHLGWGYFRDELYYLACGHHLDWGYVDHGPIVALQARLAETLFGQSLVGIRLLSSLAGAARVFVTGLLAFRLGGGRSAQGLAMLGVLVAPSYLGVDGILSMNSCESLFWMGCLLALLSLQNRLGLLPFASVSRGTPLSRMARRSIAEQSTLLPLADAPSLGPWCLFGISAGVGLLNKPSMTFFLVALTLAMLATRVGRLLLLRRETLLALGLTLLLAAPNLLWQIHYHWPTLEFLRNGRLIHKNGIFDPLDFLQSQVAAFNAATILIWLPGLIYLLRRARTRYLGLTYLFFLAIMILFEAKDYYAHPIYPVLFAAGGLAWERLSARSARVRQQRVIAFPIASSLLVLTSLYLLPTALPIFTPRGWLRYTTTAGLYTIPRSTAAHPSSPLPQVFSDRFGWQEEADRITTLVNSLSPADRRRAAILTTNYGEAGALQLLAPSLPPVISGQNSYFLWGYGDVTGDVLIAISGRTPEDLRRFYDVVQVVGNLDANPYMEPFKRQRTIYLLRQPRQTMVKFWPNFKDYI